jgi:xanthosine utilization system XapX-like protein
MRLIHWLALVPFVGMLMGPIVHNNVRPLILGMPFPLGWITVWVVLTAIVMAVVYALDPANRRDAQ